MKKLLVLALVCGMASLASAALVWAEDDTTINLGDTLTVTLVNTDGVLPTSIWVGLSDGTVAKWNSGSVTANAGNTAYMSMAAWGAEYNAVNYSGVPAMGSWSAGTWATFVLEGIGLGSANLTIEDAGGTVLDSLAVTVVPEPATMVLLGLGALVLRRKK